MSPTTASTPQQRPYQETYAHLKKINFSKCPVTLWLVYKRTGQGSDDAVAFSAGDFHWGVRRLEIDSTLERKLASIVSQKVSGSKRLEKYSFEGAVEQEAALVEDLSETNFRQLIHAVSEAGATDVVTELKHLHAAYGYMLQFQPSKGPEVFAFRRVQSAWRAKKITTLINALLKNRVLVTADDNEIFRFDQKLDFYAAEDSVFILDKSGFESAMNFRIGMERKRDELIKNLSTGNLYENIELISKLSGSHVRWLKKLAGAHKLGKCVEPAWIQRMLEFCASHNLPIVAVSGKVVITEGNCEMLVRLMNKDLLEDPIDHDLFKIDGAKEQLVS